MPDYIVTITSTCTEKVLVAADNADEAQIMVEDGKGQIVFTESTDEEITSVFKAEAS